MKRYATKKYLKEIEESELDLVNIENIFGKDVFDDENGYEILTKPLNKDFGYEGESIEISIETLEKVINKLKKVGSNYMEIMFHSDHNGYVFYGIEFKKSSKEDIEKHILEKEKRKALEKKYKDTYHELTKIEKELKSI